jgi:hypothetical protein
MSKVFVTEKGEKLVARDDVQAAAFKKAGLKEESSKKK